MAGKRMLRPRKKRVSRNGLNFPTPPPTNLITYRGPISLKTAERGIVASVRGLSGLSTGAGQVFNVLIDNNPSGADNWAAYASSWAEYKVLGMKIQYAPVYNVSTSTVASGVVVANIFHSNVNPGITTLTNAFTYGDPKIKHSTKPFSLEWRLQDTDEALWQPTSSPGRTSYVANVYSSGLTTATTYGYLYITYMIQFHNAS
jgi:hypothetical protein